MHGVKPQSSKYWKYSIIFARNQTLNQNIENIAKFGSTILPTYLLFFILYGSRDELAIKNWPEIVLVIAGRLVAWCTVLPKTGGQVCKKCKKQTSKSVQYPFFFWTQIHNGLIFSRKMNSQFSRIFYIKVCIKVVDIESNKFGNQFIQKIQRSTDGVLFWPILTVFNNRQCPKILQN